MFNAEFLFELRQDIEVIPLLQSVQDILVRSRRQNDFPINRSASHPEK